jgi:hypothetical protein
MPHKNARNDLTAEYVRSILDYDPETGLFRHKYRVYAAPGWNTKYAGQHAGCFSKAQHYIILVINARHYLAHRIAWLHVTGKWPDKEIDHINSDRSDNRLVNLRIATPQENLWNQPKKPTNASGFKGVSFFKRDGSWKAQIRWGGKQRHIGYYLTPEEAHEAYCRESAIHHGKFARHN